MRETRLSGLEGGVRFQSSSLPLSRATSEAATVVIYMLQGMAVGLAGEMRLCRADFFLRFLACFAGRINQPWSARGY